MAGATEEQRLEAVGSRPWYGAGSASEIQGSVRPSPIFATLLAGDMCTTAR
jgi:hypothetical protein